MINVEMLQAEPKEQTPPLPILKEPQVREALTAKIEAAVTNTRQIGGFFEPLCDANKRFKLFFMYGPRKMSEVSDPKETIGKFGRKRFQELTFEVMTKYGFNPDISRPLYTSGGFDAQGISHYPDGTSRQFLVYPSQTVPGLFFERETDFYTATEEPITVSWTVIGQKRPFRERLRALLPKCTLE